jgi:hypothetical protein
LGCFWSNLGWSWPFWPNRLAQSAIRGGDQTLPRAPLLSPSRPPLPLCQRAWCCVSAMPPPWLRPFSAVFDADIAGLWFVLPRSIISSASIWLLRPCALALDLWNPSGSRRLHCSASAGLTWGRYLFSLAQPLRISSFAAGWTTSFATPALPDADVAVVPWRWSLDHGRAAADSTSWPTRWWRVCVHNLGYDDDDAAFPSILEPPLWALLCEFLSSSAPIPYAMVAWPLSHGMFACSCCAGGGDVILDLFLFWPLVCCGMLNTYQSMHMCSFLMLVVAVSFSEIFS